MAAFGVGPLPRELARLLTELSFDARGNLLTGSFSIQYTRPIYAYPAARPNYVRPNFDVQTIITGRPNNVERITRHVDKPW